MADTLLAAAKRLYSRHTDNDPVIHCNRFPAWDELSESEQSKWLREARAAEVFGSAAASADQQENGR